MIEVKFLGGASEVGKSCLLVDTGVEKFVLDYGLNIQTFQPPIQPPTEIDGLFLTHAHLDHSGMIPEIYGRGFTKNTFGTKTTLDLSKILLTDAVKVQERKGLEPYYGRREIDILESMSKPKKLNTPIEFNGSVVELRDAGHIPGSSMVLLESKNKKILYTGDINYTGTELINGVDTKFSGINALITESTYSYKNHPNRGELTRKLKEKVKEVVSNNGTVLMPSFSIGRTQEMILLLHDIGAPIYLDGMGVTATKTILDNHESVADHHLLKKAFGKAHKIEKSSDRKEALKNNSIIIASAGMMQGGPVQFYMKNLYMRQDCSVILNGYQMDGTPGKRLLDTGRFVSDGMDVEVKMDIQFMDFSAHIGRDDLFKFIEKVNPEKVIPVHGEFIPEFVAELKEKGFDAVLARNGETVTV